jgi:hypothetical protein
MRQGDSLKWISTLSFLCAAMLLSSNTELSRYGFFIFLLGHSLLSYYFWFKLRDYPMFVHNSTFILVDGWGIYRWFLV